MFDEVLPLMWIESDAGQDAGNPLNHAIEDLLDAETDAGVDWDLIGIPPSDMIGVRSSFARGLRT